jgi:hypothetical protein
MRPYHWRNSYDDAVADAIVRHPNITRQELCQHTGLLSDEIADIIDRLAARGNHRQAAVDTNAHPASPRSLQMTSVTTSRLGFMKGAIG